MGNSPSTVNFLEERNHAPDYPGRQEIMHFLSTLDSDDHWDELPIDPEHSDSNAFSCHCFNPWANGCNIVCMCFSCRGLTEWSDLLLPYLYQAQFSEPSFYMDNERNKQEIDQILVWMKTKKHHVTRVLDSLLEHPIATRCARLLLEKFIGEAKSKTLLRAIKIRLNQEAEFLRILIKEFEILAVIIGEWDEDNIGRAQRVQFHHHLNRIERIKEEQADLFCSIFPNNIPERVHGILFHHNQEADYEWNPTQIPAFETITRPQQLLDMILKTFYLFGHTGMIEVTQMQEN